MEGFHIYVCSFTVYGSKAAGREKSALNVPTSPSLKESPCPNHPSYRLGSFTQLEIYICSTRTRIFTFLECQEMCAGRVEIPGNSRKSIFLKTIRKTP